MSVITFVNNIKEETGKSMSLVAIATNMAIEKNNRILIISTTNTKDAIENCFFEESESKKAKLGIFSSNASTLDTESGIEGLSKMIRSNRISPEMITNYTKVVFKDRLEVLLGTENEGLRIQEEYIEIINEARKYYDKVFVDLDLNLREDIREKIMDISDLIVLTSSQRLKSLKKLKENKSKISSYQKSKTLIMIGKYDKFSKYNSKNITRFLEEKNQVITVPYNTLFFEACEEAGVPDLFLGFKKQIDSSDRNAIFIDEVRRATESIIYMLQVLQTNI